MSESSSPRVSHSRDHVTTISVGGAGGGGSRKGRAESAESTPHEHRDPRLSLRLDEEITLGQVGEIRRCTIDGVHIQMAQSRKLCSRMRQSLHTHKHTHTHTHTHTQKCTSYASRQDEIQYVEPRGRTGSREEASPARRSRTSSSSSLHSDADSGVIPGMGDYTEADLKRLENDYRLPKRNKVRNFKPTGLALLSSFLV